jgi:hypothetical protein
MQIVMTHKHTTELKTKKRQPNKTYPRNRTERSSDKGFLGSLHSMVLHEGGNHLAKLRVVC